MVSNLTVKIGADLAGLQKELAKANGMLGKFETGLKGIGTGLVAAFSVSAVAGFAFEVSKLAAQAEGVKAAFDKLPGSVKLLNDLKQATAGTVSEFELMQRAVQANNFNISLQALPKLLEFATLRAQQTGQSVDYLVDSIVTGLGRQSVLILDNLGISAKALSDEVARVGDFSTAAGNIIDRELGKMGNVIENTMTKTDRFSASWENFKVAVGEAANGTGVLGQAIDGLSGSLDLASSKNISFWEKMGALILGPGAMTKAAIKDLTAENKKLEEEQKALRQAVIEVDRAFASGNPKAYIDATKQHIYYTEILAEYNKRLVEEEKKKAASIENIANLTTKLNSLQEQQQVLTGANLVKVNQEIKSIEEKIKKLKELGTVQGKRMTDPGNAAILGQMPEMKSFVPNAKPFEDLAIKMNAAAVATGNFQEQWAALGIAAMDVGPIINQSLIDLGVGLGEALGSIAIGAGGAEQITAMLLGTFGNMATQLGQLAIATGVGVEGIKRSLQTLQPGAAIAAGVALVALGKIVSSKAKAIASGGGGGSRPMSSLGGGGSGAANPRGGLTGQGKEIKVTGELVIEGENQRYIINRNTQKNQRRR